METTNPCTAGSPFPSPMRRRLLRAPRRPYRQALTLGLRPAGGGHTRNGVAGCTPPIRANPERSGDAKPQDPMGQLGCRGCEATLFLRHPRGGRRWQPVHWKRAAGSPSPGRPPRLSFFFSTACAAPRPPVHPKSSSAPWASPAKAHRTLWASGSCRRKMSGPGARLGHLKADGVGSDLLLICSDGHPALIKAIHATYPETPAQISVAHRLLALARQVDARWRAGGLG